MRDQYVYSEIFATNPDKWNCVSGLVLPSFSSRSFLAILKTNSFQRRKKEQESSDQILQLRTSYLLMFFVDHDHIIYIHIVLDVNAVL